MQKYGKNKKNFKMTFSANVIMCRVMHSIGVKTFFSLPGITRRRISYLHRGPLCKEEKSFSVITFYVHFVTKVSLYF
jgi:hypothetical protein